MPTCEVFVLLIELLGLHSLHGWRKVGKIVDLLFILHLGS